MADDTLNTFFNAYKAGATIRSVEEEKRQTEETKNVFQEAMSQKDKLGGEEGAFRYMAEEAGKRGNIKLFEAAKQNVMAYEKDRIGKRDKAMEHLGSAAIWLYDMKDEEQMQNGYKSVRNHMATLGEDTSTWPEKVTKEFLLGYVSKASQQGIKFWEDVHKQEGAKKLTDIKDKEVDQKILESKEKIKKGYFDPRLKGANAIKQPDFLVIKADVKKWNKPDGGKYSDQEATMITKFITQDKFSEDKARVELAKVFGSSKKAKAVLQDIINKRGSYVSGLLGNETTSEPAENDWLGNSLRELNELNK
jgi:hypothetical protein